MTNVLGVVNVRWVCSCGCCACWRRWRGNVDSGVKCVVAVGRSRSLSTRDGVGEEFEWASVWGVSVMYPGVK